MATNGSFGQQEQYKGALEAYPAAPASINAANAAEGNGNLTKDQVGWYFVEQYYTTLSKSPEKLHLFYGKRSQFVYGLEAEVANVSVGRQDIQERIKQLDFQDCKVRVSNVDSQASFENIVIQVIGETSNKAQEPKKFVQTFVLAQQPSGYFVLNDMLRYINEDAEEEATEPAADAAPAPVDGPAEAAPAESEPTKAAAPETVTPELDTGVVDQKLESTKEAPAVNGDVEDLAATEEAPATKTESSAADPEVAAREVAEEGTKEAEKPADPAPTPVTKAAASPEVAPAAPAAPAEPAAPPKPMTWASRAAAAAGPRPVVPLPKTATPPATSQSRAPAPPAPAPAAAPASGNAPSTTAAAPSAAAPAKEGSEWQTAGADSKRQNRPQSISGGLVEKEGTMGYVKFVTEKVQDADLKAALTALGELTYFDINRQKNCAFVEFKTTEGYNAAMAASPLTVNGENIIIEPRRPKATAYGGSSYGSGRGGASGRGRGGYEGGRTGGNPRGNFGGQGRGRGGAQRGRGGAQSTTAA